MSDTGADAGAETVTFFSRVQKNWKSLTFLFAVGGAAVAGYAKVDDIRDALIEADKNTNLRIDELDAVMVKQSDIGNFIGEDKLRIENCRQSLRGQKHEFRALVTAYVELEEAMRLAEKALDGQDLSDFELRRLQSVIGLRSAYQSRRRDLEKEVIALDGRIQSLEGC